MRTPLKHQEKVIDKIKDKEKFALYLSPGLGKTFTTLYDWYYSDRKNLIVVTLTSLLTTWEEEAKKMNFPTKVKILKLNKGSTTSYKEMIKSLEENERGIYIVSYNTSWRMPGLLMLNKNDFSIAFDESHKAKNRKSKQSKFAVELSKRYGRVRLLTGTPMSIGWEDYYIPLKLLGEDNIKTKTVKAFQENFMIIERKTNFSNKSTYETVIGYKDLETLKEIINKTCIFMDEKTSGVQLPEQIEKTYYIEPSKEFNKVMKDRVYKTWMIKNSGSKMMAHRTGLSGFFYGEGKFGERIVETLPKQPKKDIFRDLLESLDKKVLVLYNFEQELEDIKEIATSLNKTYSQITKENVDISGDVVIAHYVTGSTGHNLQEINHTIYYSPTIVGSDFIQSKKRTHRIGQNETCFYYYLITKNSLEERIFDKIKLNQNYTDEMFEEEYGD